VVVENLLNGGAKKGKIKKELFNPQEKSIYPLI
jgi:hypothetical protein